MTGLIPVVAIDGPSASGKGTVAQAVAAALGFHFLDSGALYRLVALAAHRLAVPLDDESALARVALTLPARFEGERIVLDGSDVTQAIREERISAGASKVAALPGVRAALVDRQRAFRLPPGLVADGRDMGSVIFPDAILKVFLTAGVEARAQRRYKQLIDKGLSASMAPLLQELKERDARDAERAAAPLCKCEDAFELDTTTLSVAEAVDAVLVWARGRLASGNTRSGA